MTIGIRHGRSRPLLPASAAIFLAVAAVAIGAVPVSASCALPPGAPEPRLQDAEILIVGTVRAVRDGDRVATVTVDEIWRAPDLPAEVVIEGGFATGDTFTSGDRIFEAGVRYLFDLTIDETGNLQDGACTQTRVWSPELAAFRPADARGPLVAEPEPAAVVGLGGWPGILATVSIVALLLIGIGVVVRRADR